VSQDGKIKLTVRSDAAIKIPDAADSRQRGRASHPQSPHPDGWCGSAEVWQVKQNSLPVDSSMPKAVSGWT